MSARSEAKRSLLVALPAVAFLLIFYWRGLLVWFQADDFAWLSLWRQVQDVGDLGRTLFAPMAQGSIRPWSERAFFLVFGQVFGIHPLPFRMAVVATQVVNLALLASVVRRMTGSAWAAGLAPVLWMGSAAVAVPMMWTSAYNQVLCAAFLLGAFRSWMAYCDTGARKWLVGQWVLFVLGLGALETMVVYPALAAAWAPGWRRWRQWAPMWAVSAAYAVVHQWAAPTNAAGTYALHVDASMAGTLAEYLGQIFGGPLLRNLAVSERWRAVGAATPWLAGLMVVFAFVWKREAGAVAVAAWVVGPLAPVLPLRDHVTTYYLVIPAAGLAMALAWAAMLCWRAPGVWRKAWAAAAIAVFLVTSVEAARWSRNFWYERGKRVQTLVLGLVGAREMHPEAALVVMGLDSQQFYASIGEEAMHAVGMEPVRLAPGEGANMETVADEPPLESFEVAEAEMRRLLEEERVEVYAVAGDRLRNVTPLYRALHGMEDEGGRRLSTRVLTTGASAGQLGSGWLGPGGEARWMGRRADVVLRPVAPARLVIEGFAPEVQLSQGPFRVRVRLEDADLGQLVIDGPGVFRFALNVPTTVVKTASWMVVLEADHTVVLPDASHASVLISGIFLEAL